MLLQIRRRPGVGESRGLVFRSGIQYCSIDPAVVRRWRGKLSSCSVRVEVKMVSGDVRAV
jgi:hypothetical protein